MLIVEESFHQLDEGSGGEVTFTDYIRPVCLPCTGTCVTPDEIVNSRGERLLSGNETEEEACAIEGRYSFSKGTVLPQGNDNLLHPSV